MVHAVTSGAARATVHSGKNLHLVGIVGCDARVHLLLLLKRLSMAPRFLRRFAHFGLDPAGPRPYHWSSVSNPFSWIPFSGFLEANREFSMPTFLRKCFWYGSAVWLLRAAGWRLAAAALAVALLLGAIEVAQIHLPGRVAEITDPLLALILAATLGLLERRHCQNSSPSAA